MQLNLQIWQINKGVKLGPGPFWQLFAKKINNANFRADRNWEDLAIMQDLIFLLFFIICIYGYMDESGKIVFNNGLENKSLGNVLNMGYNWYESDDGKIFYDAYNPKV